MNLDILNCVLVICMSVVLMVLNVWTCRREMYRDSYSWRSRRSAPSHWCSACISNVCWISCCETIYTLCVDQTSPIHL